MNWEGSRRKEILVSNIGLKFSPSLYLSVSLSLSFDTLRLPSHPGKSTGLLKHVYINFTSLAVPLLTILATAPCWSDYSFSWPPGSVSHFTGIGEGPEVIVNYWLYGVVNYWGKSGQSGGYTVETEYYNRASINVNIFHNNIKKNHPK